MKKGNIKAITLVELLLALGLAGIATLAVGASIQSAITAQREAEEAAIFSLAEAGQGVETTFQRLATAQNFELVSPNEVKFTHRSGTGRIYKEGDAVIYQANIEDDSTKTEILKNVSRLTFSMDALNRVIMELALNDAAETKIRTAARTRNPYEPTVVARWIIN